MLEESERRDAMRSGSDPTCSCKLASASVHHRHCNINAIAIFGRKVFDLIG